MKANEFIKKYGLNEARRIFNNSKEFFIQRVVKTESGYIEIQIDELKELIESHYLVRDLGGLKVAKEMYEIIKTCIGGDTLKKAITDVESCQ